MELYTVLALLVSIVSAILTAIALGDRQPQPAVVKNYYQEVPQAPWPMPGRNDRARASVA